MEPLGDKADSITEKMSLQLRCEAYNVLNLRPSLRRIRRLRTRRLGPLFHKPTVRGRFNWGRGSYFEPKATA
jgi:hypothetical protein